MILLVLFSALLAVADFILDLLPKIEIPVFEVPTNLVQIINLLNYILPMDTLNFLFGLTITITGFRIILAIINKLLGLIEVIK